MFDARIPRISLSLLKGVAEAIEHCTKKQIRDHDDSNHLRKMITSAKARLTFRIRLCRAKPQGVSVLRRIKVHSQQSTP
jgi:hypothetical protein